MGKKKSSIDLSRQRDRLYEEVKNSNASEAQKEARYKRIDEAFMNTEENMIETLQKKEEV